MVGVCIGFFRRLRPSVFVLFSCLLQDVLSIRILVFHAPIVSTIANALTATARATVGMLDGIAAKAPISRPKRVMRLTTRVSLLIPSEADAILIPSPAERAKGSESLTVGFIPLSLIFIA
jgi:hypothetical protein